MNIGLIGSGGREHALCLKLFQSNSPKKIFCFPGNAGTANIATNVEVDILIFNKVDIWNKQDLKNILQNIMLNNLLLFLNKFFLLYLIF